MAEGDTVHKIASALASALEGRVLVGVRTWGGPLPDLSGRRVQAVRVHGKRLWIELDDGRALRCHLGLSGSWHRYRAGEPWKRPVRAAGLVLETSGEVFVCFRPREVRVVRGSDPGHLGPDLVATGTDPVRLPARARALCRPEDPVADVLLDQRVASGVGNVYKSEVLFLERVAPQRRLDSVSDTTLGALFACARELLRRNLGPGPRTTRFGPDGRERLWVYRRAGRPCLRCGEPVRSARIGRHRRITYWCPRCQR